jgi:hypothetical protein
MNQMMGGRRSGWTVAATTKARFIAVDGAADGPVGPAAPKVIIAIARLREPPVVRWDRRPPMLEAQHLVVGHGHPRQERRN